MFLPHTTPAEPLPAPATWYEAVRLAVITTRRIPAGILLCLCGFGLGWVQPRHWFLLGWATLATLPAAAVAELVATGRAPTGWLVVEFIMATCMALPAIAGAAIGRNVRWKGMTPEKSVIF